MLRNYRKIGAAKTCKTSHHHYHYHNHNYHHHYHQQNKMSSSKIAVLLCSPMMRYWLTPFLPPVDPVSPFIAAKAALPEKVSCRLPWPAKLGGDCFLLLLSLPENVHCRKSCNLRTFLASHRCQLNKEEGNVSCCIP